MPELLSEAARLVLGWRRSLCAEGGFGHPQPLRGRRGVWKHTHFDFRVLRERCIKVCSRCTSGMGRDDGGAKWREVSEILESPFGIFLNRCGAEIVSDCAGQVHHAVEWFSHCLQCE